MIFSLDLFRCSACIFAQVVQSSGASESPRPSASSMLAPLVMFVLGLAVTAVLVRAFLYRSSTARGKRRLARKDEKFFADLKRNAATGKVEVPKPRLFFPGALAIGILTLTGLALVHVRHPEAGSAYWISLALQLVASAFMLIGYLMHLSFGYGRHMKYEFLLTGCLIAGMGVLFHQASNIPVEYHGNFIAYIMVRGPKIQQFILPAAIRLCIFGFLNLGMAMWSRRKLAGSLPRDGKRSYVPVSRWERGGFRLVMALGPVVLVASMFLISPLYLAIYLVIRYCLAESIKRAPILYLRSFRYSDTPTAFGLIVSKAATRYGVVVALAHQSQGPRLFHSTTNTTDHAQLHVVPDETWHEWVLDHLKRCSVVIIDRSVETDSLLWEIEQAASLVDPRKVIIMQDKSIDPRASSGFQKVSYGLSKKEAKKAIKDLKASLQKALA